MNNTIQIKRSIATAQPVGLQFGELAYSQISQTVFIGRSNGAVEAVGGVGAFASLDSPNFTGIPTAPTATTGNNSAQLATTAFVQQAITALLQNKDIKESCVVAAITNINLNTPGNEIDGVTLSPGDRILLIGQINGAENGIYNWTDGSTALTRAVDANTTAKVTPGMVVTVERGIINADTAWFLKTDDPITLGSTPLEFIAYPGSGGIVAGAGLQRSVDILNIQVDGVTVFINSNNQLAVKSSEIPNQILMSQGSGSVAFGALPLGNTNAVTGVLEISNGGLGRDTAITGLVIGNGTSYGQAAAGIHYLDPDSVIDGGTF